MHRRRFVGVAAVASLTGCLGLNGEESNGRLDLTVQNDRAEPVTAQVTVVDDEGTTYEDESNRIDSGVARAFDVTVGASGRHVVTVAGDDWGGELAWHADTCGRFDGTVRVTDETVAVAGECVDRDNLRRPSTPVERPPWPRRGKDLAGGIRILTVRSPPERCPRCGATRSYRPRYTTGGGWRVSQYVCENCDRTYDPYLDTDGE